MQCLPQISKEVGTAIISFSTESDFVFLFAPSSFQQDNPPERKIVQLHNAPLLFCFCFNN